MAQPQLTALTTKPWTYFTTGNGPAVSNCSTKKHQGTFHGLSSGGGRGKGLVLWSLARNNLLQSRPQHYTTGNSLLTFVQPSHNLWCPPLLFTIHDIFHGKLVMGTVYLLALITKHPDQWNISHLFIERSRSLVRYKIVETTTLRTCE